MCPDKVKKVITDAQLKWWEKQGLPSPVVSIEDFEAGCGRVPDIKSEFGFFPMSVLCLAKPPDLYKLLKDDARPKRQMGGQANIYKLSEKVSIFPPAVSWFCIKYWSRPGDLVLDPFGNRANIGLIANWMGRRVILNDIAPSYCDLMRQAGQRRLNKKCSWKVFNQDAANLRGVKSGGVDFILTGPPYYNVEKYEKVPGQASSFRSYAVFLEWYRDVAAEMFRVNKPGGFCAFKVGNWRARNRMIPFVYDTLKAFQEVGFELHDELICAERAPLGLGFSWDIKWRQRYTHKSHQTVLVFRRPE